MMPCVTHQSSPGFCFFILFIFETCLGGLSTPDAVNVGETAVFSCNKTCNGHLLWTFNSNLENLDILKCVQDVCTVGDDFKNSVRNPGKILPGRWPLTLSPVQYNDEGWYEVTCDGEFLCKFHLEVFVPTTVNTTVMDNITLPCYGRTEKKIADGAANILWKKDDQVVLHVENGIAKYGSAFTGRALVSLHLYKTGDLSLTITRVAVSDKGLYRCYHKPTEDHGYPGAITLNVAVLQRFWTKKVGEVLILDLFGALFDNLTVTFTGSDATDRHVCSVKGKNTVCSLDYVNRVSVINDSLVLYGLSSYDRGRFTVKDKMGEVIAINTVTVEDPVRHFWVSPSVLTCLIVSCICLFLWCKCRVPRAAEHRSYFDARHSTVDIGQQLRQGAYIGVPQQETSPYISERPSVCPRTPVEETMPQTERTTEKQDNTKEEEPIGDEEIQCNT